jgi:hypothetical protein
VTLVKPHSFDICLGLCYQTIGRQRTCSVESGFHYLIITPVVKGGKHAKYATEDIHSQESSFERSSCYPCENQAGTTLESGVNAGNLRALNSSFSRALNSSNSVQLYSQSKYSAWVEKIQAAHSCRRRWTADEHLFPWALVN